MRAAAVIIVVLGLGWAWTHHRQASLEHRLAAIATQLAGRPVGVDCQGFWAEMLDIGNRSGEVQFPVGRPPDHMFLVRSVCGRLRHFMDAGSHLNLDCLTSIDWTAWSIDADYGDCERHAQDDAEAVNTLAHEAMHLRGITSESEAQCLAIQADAWTVVRLGGTAAEGDAVANYVLALQPLLPPEYQSSECRSGGQLDATPLTKEFPSETLPAIPPLTLPSAS